MTRFLKSRFSGGGSVTAVVRPRSFINTCTQVNRFRPISITAFGITAFLVWAWIGMSSMDYEASSIGHGRQTAGWFMLGIPMLVPVAVLTTMPFSMVARRGRPAIAWLAMLAVAGTLLWIAYIQSTPHARLAWALGAEIPDDTTIYRLGQTDSFNSGITVWGACTADGDLVDDIVSRHSLSVTLSGGHISHYMPDAGIPNDGIGYRNDRLICYHDSGSNVLYFVRFSDPGP